MKPLEPSEHGLPALGRALADGLAPVSPDRLARQRARVVARSRAPSRVTPGRIAFGLASALVSAVALKALRGPNTLPRPLAARIDGAPVTRGQWIAARESPVTLRFSDGSAVTLSAGAQLRVEDLDPRGARILVERGRAEASIVHTNRSRWTFAAGPYAVQVTGTRFALGWEQIGRAHV